MTKLDGRNTLLLPDGEAHSFQRLHSLTTFSTGLVSTNCQMAWRPFSLNEQRPRLGICEGFDPRIHRNNGRWLKDRTHVHFSTAISISTTFFATITSPAVIGKRVRGQLSPTLTRRGI